MKNASLVLGLLALSALGCGAASRLGGACTTNADCDYGQICNSGGAGGFCSRGCSLDGTRGECPEGGTCSTVGTGIGTTSLICVPLCSGGGCREGYECVAAGGTVTACKPKPVQ